MCISPKGKHGKGMSMIPSFITLRVVVDPTGMTSNRLINWVRPGCLLTKASRPMPVRALMVLDFPAFDRPTKATSRPPSAGSFSISAALSRNTVLLNTDIDRIAFADPTGAGRVGQVKIESYR